MRGVYAETLASRKVKAGGDRHEKFGAAASYKIGGSSSIKGTDVVVEATAKLTLKASGITVTLTPGKVTIDGFDVTQSPHEIRKRIGFLPDTPPLYHEMSVRGYLAFVAHDLRTPLNAISLAGNFIEQMLGAQSPSASGARMVKALRRSVKQLELLVAKVLEENTNLETELGLKIERRAQELGREPQEFVDSMVPPFEEAWQQLDITNDDFIRTTSERHKLGARRLWEKLEASGDIYLADYEDWYCVGCESFKTEKELLPGNICPDHKKPVEKIREKSYFFKLSAYQDKLLAYYDANPDFVKPEGRFNEVKSFVRAGLKDLSISRSSFSRWRQALPPRTFPTRAMARRSRT